MAQVESLPHQCRGVRRCRQGRPGLDVGSWDGILHPGEVEGLHGLEVAHGVGQGSAAGLDRDLHLLADFPPNVLDLTDQPAQALARQGSGGIIGPGVAVAADSLVGIDADQHPAPPPAPVHIQHGGLHVGDANLGLRLGSRGMNGIPIVTGAHHQGAGRTG